MKFHAKGMSQIPPPRPSASGVEFLAFPNPDESDSTIVSVPKDKYFNFNMKESSNKMPQIFFIVFV